MAFEAFRSQAETRRPSRRRQLTYALSIAVHAAVIALGVVYSFWHVEELTPPLLKVTFLASAPPPPPPPPPAGGGGPAKKKVAIKPKTVVQPKTPDIVQPRETPKKEEPPKEEPKPDEDKGEKGGVKGGTAGGTPGGTVGGTPGGQPGGVLGGTPGGMGAGPPRKFLGANLGKLQWLGCTDPPFPPALRKEGRSYQTIVKICVNKAGTVESVAVMKKSEPQLDEGVVSSMKACRHRPLVAGNITVPFCYIQPFDFKSE
jgi:outer membrane biosynthesis protein TonB